MSLCFLEALAKAHRSDTCISQQEYAHHLLQHFRGVRHPQDDLSSITDTLTKIEPWAAALREIILAHVYEPLEGTYIRKLEVEIFLMIVL